MACTLSVAASLSAALLGSPVVDAGALGRLELMAGSAPLEPGADGQGAFAVEGVPVAALRLRWPRYTVTSRYGPRFFFRVPNAADLERPLVLHQGSLLYEGRFARGVDARASVAARIGEIDYTSADLIFDPAQAALSQTPVFELFEVSGASELGFSLSRRTRLAWLLDASHTESLGSEETFPSLTTLGTGATYTVRIDRRDELTIPIGVQHHAFGTGERLLASKGGASWERRLGRRSDLEVAAGVVEVEHLDGGGGSEVLPTASVSTSHGFVHRRTERLRGEVGADLLAVLDTLNAEYDPVASAHVGLELALRPRWTIGARATVFTELDEETTTGPLAYRARVTAEFPVIYRVSETALLEFGARTESRAPGLGPSDWALRDVQLWGYVAATIAFGTDATGGRWLL